MSRRGSHTVQHGHRSGSDHTILFSRWFRGMNTLCVADPRVRATPSIDRKSRARTTLGRACARRCGRHLGRGSPPQRPSSRFHGFAPREPNWVVAAPQSDSGSFDVLPSKIRSPGRGVEQTEVKEDRTSPTTAGDSSHRAPARPRPEPIHPIAIRVRPCNSPRPG